jgi:signal peptidase I
MLQIIFNFLNKYAEIITAAVIILIAAYIMLWPVKVEGTAMEDTIKENDWVLCSRFAAMIFEPKPGDLVIFTPEGQREAAIKRVIAVAGDDVRITEGSVTVNGRRFDERNTTGNYNAVVEDGSFYALGDNRANSTDSRNYGTVPVSRIKSKVIFKLYPFSEFCMF